MKTWQLRTPLIMWALKTQLFKHRGIQDIKTWDSEGNPVGTPLAHGELFLYPHFKNPYRFTHQKNKKPMDFEHVDKCSHRYLCVDKCVSKSLGDIQNLFWHPGLGAYSWPTPTLGNLCGPLPSYWLPPRLLAISQPQSVPPIIMSAPNGIIQAGDSLPC